MKGAASDDSLLHPDRWFPPIHVRVFGGSRGGLVPGARMIGPFVLIGALNFAKLARLALSAVDRLRARPARPYSVDDGPIVLVSVAPRALDAPARERRERGQS
jgi:hypothetical protein